MKTPKIGLVLGGGAAKAFAHIGFYQVLHDHHIPLAAISGTSMGAIIGAMIAYGVPPRRIYDTALRFSKKYGSTWKLRHLKLKNGGVLSAKQEVKTLCELLPPQTEFSDLKIPLAINAVDLESGEEVVLKEGNLQQMLLASSALPGIYPPVFHEDRLLVDGGVLNCIPVNLCRDLGVDKVIAIDLKSRHSEQVISGLIYHFYIQRKLEKEHHLKVKHKRVKEMMMKLEFPLSVMARTMAIAEERLAKLNLEKNPPDLLIHPRIEQYDRFDYEACDAIYAAGVEAAYEVLPQIQAWLTPRTRRTARTARGSGGRGGTSASI